MGGLFSSEPRAPPRRTQSTNYSYGYESQRSPVRQTASPTTTTGTPRNYQHNIWTLQKRWDSLSIHDRNIQTGAGSTRVPSRQIKPPIRSVRDNNRCSIGSDPYFDHSAVVTFFELAPFNDEYIEIARIITNRRRFRVDSIEKIENPYLKRAYQLKKEQKQKEYLGLEERLLFHGTTRANLDRICKFNFDYRFCKAHKFGKGVSFSPNANYASNYSDNNIHNKVMIVAKVLVGRSCIGNDRMVLPPNGCDTSQKGHDGIVIVKYEDNEYLPVYKINYHLVEQVANAPRRGNRNNRGGGIVIHNYYDNADDDLFHFYD